MYRTVRYSIPFIRGRIKKKSRLWANKHSTECPYRHRPDVIIMYFYITFLVRISQSRAIWGIRRLCFLSMCRNIFLTMLRIIRFLCFIQLFFICRPLLYNSLCQRMLGLNPEAEFLDVIGTKVWRVFLFAFDSHFYQQILPSPSFPRAQVVWNWFVYIYGYLKSDNSQDYAQKPQRNCTFMNSASGLCCNICIGSTLYKEPFSKVFFWGK